MKKYICRAYDKTEKNTPLAGMSSGDSKLNAVLECLKAAGFWCFFTIESEFYSDLLNYCEELKNKHSSGTPLSPLLRRINIDYGFVMKFSKIN